MRLGAGIKSLDLVNDWVLGKILGLILRAWEPVAGFSALKGEWRRHFHKGGMRPWERERRCREERTPM